MAGQSCLFRLTTAGENEGAVGGTEKIEFNGGVVPDAKGFLEGTDFEMGTAIGEMGTPGANLTSLQDGGLYDTIITIKGLFEDRNTAPSSAINLFNWMNQNKDNDDFPEGRFGLRLNDFGIFDLTPSGTLGYYLQYVKWIVEGEYFQPVGFIAILKKSKGA